MTSVPTYDQLMNPTIQALKQLGGSGTIKEIYVNVAQLMSLSEAQLSILHDPSKGSQTEVEYRLAWARTYLKKYGVLDISGRGVWTLTATGLTLEKVDPKTVQKYVREVDQQGRSPKGEVATFDQLNEEVSDWRERAIEALLDMDPSAFERLVQRLLRESNFVQVEVTGRSGDGGIDGKGIMRINGMMSFHVLFQCKRYRGSVVPSEIRDFRGAMIGRADKGLFATTGSFTRDAIAEATRDGAPAIDLLDGKQLVDKLKELGLGITTKIIEIEEVSVDTEWFKAI